MDSVNKTLYIPLRGKAYVSRKGIILQDPRAEEIWAAEGFPLRGKSASKWLAYYMGMRSAVFDRWVSARMDRHPDALILHLGCGMDSRAERVGTQGMLWFDVDFPGVIAERRRYFQETSQYRMLPSDIRDTQWLEQIPRGGRAIVVMEGVSMYLGPEDLRALLLALKGHFGEIAVLMDCYTEFAAKASRYKNPINDVGVTRVYGMDDPHGVGLTFVREHDMTPDDLIASLSRPEQAIFRPLYAGKLAKKLYRLYEFR